MSAFGAVPDVRNWREGDDEPGAWDGAHSGEFSFTR
jgi:hypothetical protein